MATAMLKRVVIDNYKIFHDQQGVDFTVNTATPDNSRYFLLVGENGCGKSTFLALAGLASDFGGRVSKSICDNSRESMVACEYNVTDWAELSYVENYNLSGIYPAFELWFLTGILKIPKELNEFLAEMHPGLTTNPLTVVIGFKHKPNVDGEAVVSKFLYVKFRGQTVAVVQPFNEDAKIAVVGSSISEDLLFWSPDPSILKRTSHNFLRCSTPDISNVFDSVKPKHTQTAVILGLRNTLPVESCDAIWDEVIALFHQLTGDAKITVVYDAASNSIHMKQQFDGRDSIRDDLPEGFFHAFVMAFLIVSPLSKTVLLDEPTRGMHPLQIRRLQRILSEKSIEKDKVIVVATHAPDMVHVSRIHQIFRFQRLATGFTDIRRVSRKLRIHRDMRFVSSWEARELFFTRRIIWVEGDTDRRFCDAALKLIDDGDEVLWNALLEPKDREAGGSAAHSMVPSTGQEADVDEEGEESSGDEVVDYGNTSIDPLENLFASPAYRRRYFSRGVLEECQELARSCGVLPLSGKKNVDKATRICKDLGIPYAVLCDLDAVLPNKKRYSIRDQFTRCAGDWSLARVDKRYLFDGEQSPVSTCVVDPALKAGLRSCRNAYEIMEFYEAEEGIFAWRVGNGEIEDMVRVTKRNFAKKKWPDFTFDDFQTLIQDMLHEPRRLGGDHAEQLPNPELLRCLYFILGFLQKLA